MKKVNQKTLVSEGFLCVLGDDFAEDVWIFLRDLRENLAIESDVLFLQGIDQDAVGRATVAGGSVDAQGLQGAVVAFLQFAVAIGVDAGFRGGGLGERDLGFAPPHHALGAG